MLFFLQLLAIKLLAVTHRPLSDGVDVLVTKKMNQDEVIRHLDTNRYNVTCYASLEEAVRTLKGN
jgi:hypothetical protein